MKKEMILETVLREEKIYAVYQPIVCLQTGGVIAYEALSRVEITEQSQNQMSISELFALAKQTGRLFALETLCRKQALAQAVAKPQGKKLFLNIDPTTMFATNFILEFSQEQLSHDGLRFVDIVFELSEQTAIAESQTVKTVLKKYQQKQIEIAIDDFGSGYSDLQRIQSIRPKYIKIDLSLIRDIETDSVKQAIVESLVHLSKRIEVMLIAEGVETESELKKIIELGVHYAQGYFIQHPLREFKPLNPRIIEMIIQANKQESLVTSFGRIESLAKPQMTVSPATKAEIIYERFRENNEISEYCIVQSDAQVTGVITRKKLLELFSGQYGYNLHAKKPISDLMETNFFSVDAATTIEEVAKRAMSRPTEQVYDAVIVTNKRKYLGVVTIKTLLAATVEFQIRQAKEANPLTQMPGNNEIKRQIHNRVANDEQFAIMYFDLDGFKAYNDIYGFEKGDQMIKTLAYTLNQHKESEWFSGHVGGDDFVVIGAPNQVEQFCHRVFQQFDQEKQKLYRVHDWEQGYLEAKNRQNQVEKFSLATISVAVVTNDSERFHGTTQSVQTISEFLTAAKKQSKQQRGHSIVVI